MRYLVLFFLSALGVAQSAVACTGFYVGKKASADGSTLIGRTVDTSPWTACFRVLKVPCGEGVRYAYVCTPAVTSLKKGTFASACANEKGLVVSGTVTARTSESAQKADPFVPGGRGEADLPGLIAGNAATAAEAVDLLAREIAAVGHRGAEIYMFADKAEAWYVEVYTGHQWAAVRMPEDKVACFGNQFMIRSFDPASRDCRHSPDLLALAERKGFLVRGADGLPDLSATYAPPPRDSANYRAWFGHKTLSPFTAGKYEKLRAMPLFYAPFKKVALDGIFELMRSRYEATAMCPDEGGPQSVRTIGTTKQATCHVLVVRDDLPDAYAATVWTALANAEHSVFLPIGAAVTETDAAFAHDNVEAEYAYDPRLAGNAFRRLCALAEQSRRFYGTGVRAFWRQRERELLASYPKTLEVAAAKDDAAALTDFAKREQARALADAKRLFDELIWYVAENNRVEGDGSGATVRPKAAFRPTGLAEDDPADSVYSWWPSRSARKRREIEASGGAFDVVFVGDSITHSFGDDKGAGVPVWKELAQDCKMLNLGYSGTRTQNMIWRLEHGELDGYRAKAFVVMAGTNNAGANRPEDTARGIARLVATIRERQPQATVFLLAIFPRGEKPDDPLRLTNDRVNALIRPLADGRHVVWRDLTDFFLSADGTLPKDVCGDFLHPTEIGYHIWAEAMADDFRRLKAQAEVEPTGFFACSDQSFNGLVRAARRSPPGDLGSVSPTHLPSRAFVNGCRRLQEIATAGAEDWKRQAESVRTELRTKFGRSDGIWDNGSQTAEAMALAFGLCDGEMARRRTGDRLLMACDATDYRPDVGPLGSKYLFRSLGEIGRFDIAVRLLKHPKEPCDPILFGDVAASLRQYVGGIRVPCGEAAAMPYARQADEAEWLVAPQFVPQLKWAKASVETPHGPLRTEWRRTRGSVTLTVWVPDGLQADIRLPSGATHRAKEGKQAFTVADGVF